MDNFDVVEISDPSTELNNSRLNVNESIVDFDKISNFVSYRGFINQNISSFRSNITLTFVLGYILSFGVFCLIFFAKNYQYSGIFDDPIAIFSLEDFKQNKSVVPSPGSSIYRYTANFTVEKNLNEKVLVYFEYYNFFQSNSGFLLGLNGIKKKSLAAALKTPLSQYYPYLDDIEITTKTSTPISFAVTQPSSNRKFGKLLLKKPITIDSREKLQFPSSWGLDPNERDKNEDIFMKTHFTRFSQWLFPSPFNVATKVLGTVKNGLKMGEYELSMHFNRDYIKKFNLKIIIKTLDSALVKSDLQVYLLVFFIVTFVAAVILIILRFLFPRPQKERDIVFGYRKKMKFNI